ncbi:MAG: hypothetical protein OEY38_04925 [Gammaproteobacteria bacterium]|nr:hypothetical protein [Gammaproteobacteria bacterium]
MQVETNSSLHPWMEKFEQVPPRKRILYFLGLLVLFYAMLDMLVYTPQRDELNQLQGVIKKLEQELKTKHVQLNKLKKGDSDALIDPKEKAIRRTSEEIKSIEQSILDKTQRLVGAEAVFDLLKQLLSQVPGVSIVSMENLPPVVLSQASPAQMNEQVPKQANPNSNEDGLYRHSMRVILQGSYRSLYRYLHQLEQFPTQVFWQSFSLSNEKYPVNQVTLELYTLSTQADWMRISK